MNFSSSKLNDFAVVMATYASANTDYSYDYFYDLFVKDGDNWLNYLLRCVLPSEYTFDGIKEVCLRDESENHIDLVAIFWFLTERGNCLVSAFQFSAECLDDNIEFEYSILSHERFDWLIDTGNPICKTLAECIWPSREKGRLNG
jgi:hypothetical protein